MIVALFQASVGLYLLFVGLDILAGRYQPSTSAGVSALCMLGMGALSIALQVLG